MATATAKTKSIQRIDIPVGQLLKNERNPNKMKAKEFDLLVDNVNKMGIVDPIMVRPIITPKGKPQKYRIVGGHHRFDVAVYLEFDTVPCSVITDPNFDEDEEKFQLVRMNMIKGHLDPAKFFDLASEMMGKYGDELLQDSFGFADDAEWKKLVAQTAKALPDAAMQKKFKEAAKEIKTIDGLSALLNKMFTQYGDTLPYGFMVFEYGKQHNVWLECSKKTHQAFQVIGDICVDKRRTVDDLIGAVIQQIAKGELKEFLAEAIKNTPEVELPDGLQSSPTKQNLDNYQKVA